MILEKIHGSFVEIQVLYINNPSIAEVLSDLK